ncbi:MAG: phosphonate C-P lyase system protein PhnH [Bosea sp.]|uniref:phosphonate C-P lyase system protein PhnH n=1 Tax=unclassified Bosea (in: a-proteobacteria) TaxID=2653178 RepID=UPI000967D35D|nr:MULTISPECIES: phosphonate C-P lyase system protein PhnH [unclassified Bosea (in: a-proteobacteria)]MBN9455420.1 phosphonate C-P lyase system protein PhnH [Bosea sp. (in: a-proteobacteria)]OJV05025.1 MAG: phosphonate C-P lyase system protein PhnH [Bosea sp. 67-29]
MSDETMIAPGFSDPVFQSQAAFRALLTALSEPGTLQQVAGEVPPPEGLTAATATALLTLADYETPVWLPEALRSGPAGAWLRFHCGATVVDKPAEAAFAVIDGMADEPKLSAFNLGTDQFPDRSTTVIVQIAGLEGGPALTLAGPGIPGSRNIAPLGLRPGFTDELRENGALYPLGVDVLLAHGEGLIGLPRSTQVEEAR